MQEGMRRNLRWPWNPVTTAPAPEVAWVIPTSWCDRKMAEFCVITHHPVLRASTGPALWAQGLLTVQGGKWKENVRGVTGFAPVYLSHVTEAHVTLPRNGLVCARYNKAMCRAEQVRRAAHQIWFLNTCICLFLFALRETQCRKQSSKTNPPRNLLQMHFPR